MALSRVISYRIVFYRISVVLFCCFVFITLIRAATDFTFMPFCYLVGSHKRRQGRKYISAKSTSVDQPRGSKVFEPIHQAKSDGHLGPYDGHGKRGRNLIARIKDLSESSSSSGNGDDDDELTNAGVFRSKIKERHSAMGMFCWHELNEVF